MRTVIAIIFFTENGAHMMVRESLFKSISNMSNSIDQIAQLWFSKLSIKLSIVLKNIMSNWDNCTY